jgi:hypothetical protein
MPLLTSCIEAPVSASGSVTLSWNGSAVAYPNGSGEGDFIDICAASATECGPQYPGSVVYTFYPADGAASAVLVAGTTVTQAGGGTVSLPAGDYTMQANQFFMDSRTNPASLTGPVTVGALLSVTVADDAGPTPEPIRHDPPDWLQQWGRPTGDSACLDDSTQSWAQWMNDGTGGDVCSRTLTYSDGTGWHWA